MIAVHEAERAEQSQDWASAAVAYGSARQALWNARMQYDWIDQLVLAEAVALAKAGRVDQAQRWTSRLVEDARSFDPAHDQRVCLHSQVLETVAAIALANNDCARGNELARDAARFRKSCTHRVCQATDPVWCDAPSYATWRTKHACGRRLPLDTPGIVNGSR